MNSSVESLDAKKAVFRRLVELYALGDRAALDDLIATDYVGHTANGDRDLGAFKQSIAHFHEMFVYDADSFIIEDQLADGDKVATRMTAKVKLRETGEPVTLLGINIARIVDGKIVEEWNTWEQLDTAGSLSVIDQG